MTTKKNNIPAIVYIVITILGIILACTNLISNDYLQLIIVMFSLGIGIYGLLKGLNSHKEKEESVQEK